jgi:hypothetical protein
LPSGMASRSSGVYSVLVATAVLMVGLSRSLTLRSPDRRHCTIDPLARENGSTDSPVVGRPSRRIWCTRFFFRRF